MVQPWRVHSVRYFTTAYVGRALRYILAAGAVKFRRMPVVFYKGIHSLRRQLRNRAMQGLSRRVNSLTQPFVHWYFFLFSFWFLSYVYTVEQGHSWPIQLHPGAFFVDLVNFLDHGGFGDIVATFSSVAVPSKKVNCRERAHGPNMVKRVSSRSNGLLTQNPLSGEVRSLASGPPEVGPFFGSASM